MKKESWWDKKMPGWLGFLIIVSPFILLFFKLLKII